MPGAARGVLCSRAGEPRPSRDPKARAMPACAAVARDPRRASNVAKAHAASQHATAARGPGRKFHAPDVSIERERRAHGRSRSGGAYRAVVSVEICSGLRSRAPERARSGSHAVQVCSRNGCEPLRHTPVLISITSTRTRCTLSRTTWTNTAHGSVRDPQSLRAGRLVVHDAPPIRVPGRPDDSTWRAAMARRLQHDAREEGQNERSSDD